MLKGDTDYKYDCILTSMLIYKYCWHLLFSVSANGWKRMNLVADSSAVHLKSRPNGTKEIWLIIFLLLLFFKPLENFKGVSKTSYSKWSGMTINLGIQLKQER